MDVRDEVRDTTARCQAPLDPHALQRQVLQLLHAMEEQYAFARTRINF